MVSNLQNEKPESIAKMGQAEPPESKANLLALKPTIEDIHDRSENENDTQNKTSMKNVLYEPGICNLCMLNKFVCINIAAYSNCFITQNNLILL